METYVPFDVLGNFHSLYLAVTPDTTYAAYNAWGGYSLYDADNVVHVVQGVNLPRGVEVSFDRPYADTQGASQVLVYEIDAIRWMERQLGVETRKASAIQMRHLAVLGSLGRGKTMRPSNSEWPAAPARTFVA